MTLRADRWTKIEDVYHRARDCHGEERSRLLEQACGSDATMRGEVEALLRADETGNSLFDRPAGILMREWCSRTHEERLSGTRVGVYEVLDLIGSGAWLTCIALVIPGCTATPH